ncbi:MAG TPA: hypothetical protein VEY07_05635, partial [Thermoplasmata archaeon]|nr:hypothetical protein [Thermoplasmata archaeon]
MTTHGRAPSLSGPGLHHPAITPSTGGRHGNISNPIAPSGDCFGIWPPGGQEYYANGCYGHDEPGIQFYSSLAGSGGNVSWNVTLPVSRDPADTQSDLYTAIWFGMTLSDPFAWMDQCFLELQFYPDSDWYSSGSVYGSWVGAAVAWQIEALTGYEDACYYQQLVQANQNELLMTQGDQIFVTMSGWVGDPYGENITIEDRTQHEWSNLTMFNSAQNYPLDPAYVTNSYPNGLQWTPGGEYPVVFAYEVGHTSSPFPNNNSYGGCSAGTPPSTIVDPAVPCPSYDPTSWANDTVRPWRIAPPVFFNATRREQPAQVAFTQDLGGISLVDWLSNYTCVGREGSAFCSYPWYSYSCADRAFEFGATDWPTTSVDFGGYNEYSRTYENDALQQGFYPPTNFSIPACGQPSYSVTIGPGSSSGGAPYFLSQAVPVNRTFSGLAPGEYALAATVAGSENFLGWVSQGKIWASDNASPTTTLWVEGNGSVYATFTALPIQKTSVSFVISPTSAKVVILPSLYYTTGVPIATVSNGGSVTLAPGTYSIQAYPPAGYNFSSWTIQGPSNAAIAAPGFPYTWLVVPGTPVDLTVHSTSVTSSSTGVVYYGTYYGSGKVSFDGGPASSGSSKTVSVGTYTLVATPGTGYAFDGWYVSSSGVLSDFRAQSNVTIENGTTYYAYAFFEPSVEIRASPSADGRVSLDSGPP